MAGPQLAQPVRQWNGYSRTLVNPAAASVIRFEDNEQWNCADVSIVCAVVMMIFWTPAFAKNGHVTLDELATRVKQKTEIRKKYILACLPRLLRIPIDEDGKIKGIVFRE